MSISVRHNATATATARLLGQNQSGLQRTLDRVSSGDRLKHSAADAAGSAVNVKLNVRASSTQVAIRNARDGQSMIQTSEAALNETANIVVRMRELAVQSASETLEDGERQHINTEFVQLLDEVKRLTLNGDFNDQNVVSGQSYDVQVGTDNTRNDRITITTGNVKTLHTGLSAIDLASAPNAQTGISRLDTVMDRLNDQRAGLGAIHNRLDNAISNAQSQHASIQSAASRIRDADMASETTRLTAQQIKQQAGTAALSQANQLPSSVVQLI